MEFSIPPNWNLIWCLRVIGQFSGENRLDRHRFPRLLSVHSVQPISPTLPPCRGCQPGSLLVARNSNEQEYLNIRIFEYFWPQINICIKIITLLIFRYIYKISLMIKIYLLTFLLSVLLHFFLPKCHLLSVYFPCFFTLGPKYIQIFVQT